MKRIQGKNVIGYATIKVTGKNPEFFFQACANEKIPVWGVKKQTPNTCVGNIYVHHLPKMKELEQVYEYEITTTNKSGYLTNILELWKRKEIIISIILCAAIIFIMSNIVWKVDVSGVSVDVEKKIYKQLSSYGLYEGAWAYSLESLDIIQKDLLNNIPELLYIGIQKKGTTFYVDAVEKLIVTEEEQLSNQHLIAAKNGIIQKMYIKQGLPVVEVNDFVKKGDMLVSGIIEKQTDEEENGEEGVKDIVVADGEVYANTWYEVNVNSSLHHYFEKLSGEKIVKYHLKFGNIQVPIWGFRSIPFEDKLIETEEKPIYFLKWNTPFQLIQQTTYNKEAITYTRTTEEAKKVAIDHVKEDLQLKLGKDAQLLKYYVLHESVENGKVKLNLYISVLENIAKSDPIH